MNVEMLATNLFIWLLFGSVAAYYVYRLWRNDWVIDLKRWNVVAQYRSGRRESSAEDDS